MVHLVSQDLSVAGKREGLSGERSGLFMEQIRIIKEMRDHDKRIGTPDHLVRPRFAIWENVPGALSSNKGKDFQAVLTQFVRIAEPKAPDVPLFGGGVRNVGKTADVCTMKWEHGPLLGEYTTHSFGVSPREENVSRLSQILQGFAPQKYYLSAKACAGILRRAEKRGKELPTSLKEALERQAKADA